MSSMAQGLRLEGPAPTLMTLLPELRLRIREFALAEDTITGVYSPDTSFSTTGVKLRVELPHHPATRLLLLNGTIHNEVQSVRVGSGPLQVRCVNHIALKPWTKAKQARVYRSQFSASKIMHSWKSGFGVGDESLFRGLRCRFAVFIY
jgi:hypothetical protein